jgi:hypothetical protein
MLSSSLGRDIGCAELKFFVVYLRPSTKVQGKYLNWISIFFSNSSFINQPTIPAQYNPHTAQVRREKAKLSLRLIN